MVVLSLSCFLGNWFEASMKRPGTDSGDRFRLPGGPAELHMTGSH